MTQDREASEGTMAAPCSGGVTLRPKRVYGTCNRRGAYVYQKIFLII